MAHAQAQKPVADSRFLGLFQPGRGISLAMEIRSGKARMEDLGAVLASQEFRAAYSCLAGRSKKEVSANLMDLMSACRAMYFPRDQAYDLLVCQPIRSIFNLPLGRKCHGNEKAMREFFKYGGQIQQK